MADNAALVPETPNPQEKQAAPTGSHEADPASRTVDYPEVLELRKKNAQLEIELARQLKAHEGTRKETTPAPPILSEADLARIKELESELANLKKAELAKLAKPTSDAEQALPKPTLSEIDLAKLKEYGEYVARMRMINDILIAAECTPLLVQPPPTFGPIPARAPIAIDLTGIGEPEDKERTDQEDEGPHSKQGGRKRTPSPPRREVHRRFDPKEDNAGDASEVQRQVDELKKAMLDLKKSRKEEDKEPRAAIDALSEPLLANLPHYKMSHVSFTDYSGDSDPYDWLSAFESRMLLTTQHRPAWCVAMVGCLKEKASTWLRKLPAGSIFSWEDMRSKFLTEFKDAQRPRKSVNDLFMTKQSAEEASGTFYQRFVQVYDQTRGVDDDIVRLAFQTGLASGELRTHLTLNPPDTLRGMFEQARKYGTIEVAPQRGKSSATTTSIGASYSQSARRDERELKKPQQFEKKDYIPLNARPSEILNEIKEHVRPPRPLQSDLAGRLDKGYCEFHRDHGHDTDNCWTLKGIIDKMIRGGKLQHYKQVGAEAPHGGKAPRYERELN